MPELSDKPGLAVIIASKKPPKKDDGEGDDKAAEEMGAELMGALKGEDPKAFGKSLMNFVKFAVRNG